MIRDVRLKWLSAILMLALPALGAVSTTDAAVITHGGTSVTIDFVAVGDPGNVGDVQSQGTFGAVGYVYNIGKYEVSENQWDTVSGITGDLLNDPGHWSGNQPVARISWHEAAMFCNWLTSGNVTLGAYIIDGGGQVTGIDRTSAQSTYGTAYFIPTEDEWYKAAYYKGGGTNAGYWDYPTQDVLLSPPDGIDSLGDSAFDAVFNDGYDQGKPNDVKNAGELSAYGTMGQGGNVWEGTETAIGSHRIGRGGSCRDDVSYLRASYRDSQDPSFENPNVGFRVASNAAVPEPGSILVWLGLGVVGLIWCRRRS